MEELNREHESHRMGMHTEQLAGRTQQIFFAPEETENFASPDSFDVDFNKRTEIDAAALGAQAVNVRIRELMQEGYGTVVVKNPGAKHSLGVDLRALVEIDTFDPYEGEVRVWKS